MSLILGILDSGGAAVSASSYESIASGTGTGSNTTITFSSIPSTYKHLQIRGIYRDTAANATRKQITFQFNSDTGSNYIIHEMRGDGATITLNGYTSFPSINVLGAGIGNSATANIFGASITDIHDYTSTTKNKTTRSIAGVNNNNTTATNQAMTLSSGLWLNTSAITSITIGCGDTAFASGTVFSLYGIKG
jgi:hypothetical protein